MSTIQTKATIVVLSDPKGGDEALGRVFNALAAAYDFKSQGRPVQLVFQGTGTRWIAVLGQADHPAHTLFKAVEDTVGGASAGCSTLFGAKEDAVRAGFALLASNAVPGTAGLPSLVQYVSDGPVLTF
jgi:hypothetical protein